MIRIEGESIAAAAPKATGFVPVVLGLFVVGLLFWRWRRA
jgi:hypothetical protein